MELLEKASQIDIIAKVAIINLAAIACYVVLICFAIPLLVEGRISEDYILNFKDAHYRHLNLASLFGAAVFASIIAFLLRERKDREMEIIKSVLSDNDKAVLDIVQDAGEITQDSLKYRLDWSRSKVSTIVTNLEKRNLVQRKREGKTYTLFVPRR